MLIKLDLHAIQDELILSVPQADYRRAMVNLVAYKPEAKRVFSVGETKVELKQKLADRWNEASRGLVFRSAFLAEEPDIELDKYVLWRFTREAHRQVRGSKGLIFFLQRLFDRFEVNLSISTFNRLPKQHQQLLIYFLQVDLQARKVTINGNSLEIPYLKRRLEVFTRILLTLTIPYLFIGVGVFFAYGATKDASPLPMLALVFLLGFAIEVAGEAAWMLLLRRFLPPSYLRYFLPRLPLQVVVKRLADRFLNES